MNDNLKQISLEYWYTERHEDLFTFFIIIIFHLVSVRSALAKLLLYFQKEEFIVTSTTLSGKDLSGKKGT